MVTLFICIKINAIKIFFFSPWNKEKVRIRVRVQVGARVKVRVIRLLEGEEPASWKLSGCASI